MSKQACLWIAVSLMSVFCQAVLAESPSPQPVTSISFRESGGFVPRNKGCDLKVETMPAGEAASLQAFVDQSGVWTLKPGPFDAVLAPDEIGYTISVNSGAHKYVVTYRESKVPKALRPLIQFLQSRSVDLPKDR